MTARHSGESRSRARRGAVRDAVLVALAERPMHGYELITELEARSGGRWRPSPGSIYPTLTKMTELGLIAAALVDGRKVYTLTERGEEISQALDLGAGPDAADSRHRDDADAVLRAVPAEIVGQARQLRRFGSAEQIDRAAGLLTEVRQRLYAVLADGANGSPKRRSENRDD